MKRVLFVILMMSAWSSTVQADALSSTLGEPVREITHDVKATIADGVVTYKVVRTFANLGKRHDEADLDIYLPPNATATGLRIRSGSVWYDAQLMDAKKAQQLYDKLTGLGPHRPKDPALLSWKWADQLNLKVFPVPPKKTAVVEYTLVAPAEYSNGQYVFYYPRGSNQKTLTTPTVRLSSTDIQDQLFLKKTPLAQHSTISLNHLKVHPLCKAFDRSNACIIHKVNVLSEPSKTLEAFKVSVDIRHTYRSDLVVDLVSPGGHVFKLHDGKGGSENDLEINKLLSLPKSMTFKGQWYLRIMDNASLDTGYLRQWHLEFNHGKTKKIVRNRKELPMFIPDATSNETGLNMARFVLRKHKQPNLFTARFGVVDRFAKVKFMNMHLDMANPISTIPEKLAVVFVLDVSHSQGIMGVQAQLEIMQSYLKHTPKARVEVVTYARDARRALGSFSDVKTLPGKMLALWKAGRFNTHNGSHLDRGVLLALKVLESVPEETAKRLIVLGDGELRSTYRNESMLPVLKKQKRVVTHLVVNSGGHRFSAKRQKVSKFSPLVLPSGGIVTSFSGLPTMGDKYDGLELEKSALHLVRPTRIEFLSWTVDSSKFDALPDVLSEGEGIREFHQVKKVSKQVVIQGQVWSKPFRRVVRPNARFNKYSAGWVFSADLYDDLTDKQQYSLAMHAGVVSPQTSFLAVEPGVRPSTVGLEGRGSGSGFGGIGGTGRVRLGKRGKWPKVNLQPLFQKQALLCAAKHNVGSRWSFSFSIETISREIVDVLSRQKKTSAFHTCILDRAWVVNLMKERMPYKTKTYTIFVQSS